MSLLTESTFSPYVEPKAKEEHRKYDVIPHCQFNEGVSCEAKGRKCKMCGWNPTVAEMRLQAIEMGDTHFLRFIDRSLTTSEEINDSV